MHAVLTAPGAVLRRAIAEAQAAVQALSDQLDAAKGAADGYAALDGSGLVPTAQLPAYPTLGSLGAAAADLGNTDPSGLDAVTELDGADLVLVWTAGGPRVITAADLKAWVLA